jgi:Protein of unknown function (DUF1553)/Protein of unknown function (DUF1549)/Concanavalin A-like lectin/glucanases superfamily/Planctomycete cytochrome C
MKPLSLNANSKCARRQTSVLTVVILSVGWWGPIDVAASGETRPLVSYDRDIRPILSDKCYHCHGPDAAARQAELRLDNHKGLMQSVVVAGKPDESELIARVFSVDDDIRMPPADSHLTLSADQKELLRRWIAEGADIAEHWAFQELPSTVPIPAVKDDAWPRETLDRFVLARLEAEDLQPTPQAEPLRLLRRITLDLTGLPPTADACRDFESASRDEGLDASLAREVDRLLGSSAFGEHLAVAWLDATRYADSYGYQSDQLNTQWPYRDWVVRALNANLPYDRFITWQLAGDLLDKPSRDHILATAFNRLHRLTNEGGSIAEEWLVENAADRVQTFGTAILGLTLECARCHDHKYDPITAREYYSLMAFFNSIDENGMYDHAAKVPSPSLLLPTPEQEAALLTARENILAVESALANAVEQGEERFDNWLEKARVNDDADIVAYFTFDGNLQNLPNQASNDKIKGTAADLQRVPGVRGSALRFDGDHGAVFPGMLLVDRWDRFSIDFWIRDNTCNSLPAVVLQRTFGTDVGYNGFDIMLQDGIFEVRLYRVWPGNGIGVRSKAPMRAGAWHHVTITYDGSSSAAGLRLYTDGEESPTDVVRDRIHKSASLEAGGDGHLTLGQRFRDRGFEDGEIDELRIFKRDLTPLEIRDLHDGEAIRIALADPISHRQTLKSYYFSTVDEPARKIIGQLGEARRKLVELEDAIQEVPVMAELAAPRPTFILARGAYDAPKSDANRVERGTFADILTPFPDELPKNRLGLARWLVHPRHPLTARVFVNRVWANFFGRHLVSTPENFGRQGAVPTHPELLDWLARDFIDHHWNIKRLCRTIVLSATYRQDSRGEKDLRERDPENELLARGASRRLSAEQIRDLALAASGLLDRRIGGPPVSPYQPGGDLWRETNIMSPAYRQSIGVDLYRRSLYSVWKRTAPLPNMLAFDATTREVCTVSRGRTNTPLQALVLLNDVQFVEAARVLAVAVSHHHNVRDQTTSAFLRLTGRSPGAHELSRLIELYDEQRKLFVNASEQNAAKFLTSGESRLDSGAGPVDLAALTVTCQAILNLDATIYER